MSDTTTIYHTTGHVMADLDTMTLYVGIQDYHIESIDDVSRMISTMTDTDLDIMMAAIQVAIYMIDVQMFVVIAQNIASEQRVIGAATSEQYETTVWSFAVRSWLYARLLLPFQ